MHNGDHFTNNLWSDGFTMNSAPGAIVADNLVSSLFVVSRRASKIWTHRSVPNMFVVTQACAARRPSAVARGSEGDVSAEPCRACRARAAS
jgi:hypothetical protein